MDDEARLRQILSTHREFRRSIVPLCAAETPLSDFVRSFMDDPVHETYAMGGPRNPATVNFAGAGFVLGLHQLTIDLCRSAYGAEYADPRPHSGTGAVTAALLALSSPGDRIMLQTVDSGGHASMEPISRRLGLDIVDLPFDFDRLEPDLDAMRRRGLDDIDLVLYAPSDTLYPASFRDLGLPEHAIVLLDLTQTLGLIASGHHPSPFDTDHSRTIVLGGTHKTLPGPSTGLILTNDPELADRIDGEVSPKFVRHSHPHHIAALCATLIEHRVIGGAYGDRILAFSSALAEMLSDAGMTIVQADQRATETHQVWLHIDDDRLDAAIDRVVSAGMTPNPRRKALFRSSGIRIGVQEISRYQWSTDDLLQLSAVIAAAIDETETIDVLQGRVRMLAARNVFAPDLCLPNRP